MNSRQKKKMGIALCILLIGAILFAITAYFVGNIGFGPILSGEEENGANPEAAEAGTGEEADTETGVVFYQGKKYQYNKDLVNVLFLGIDTTESVNIQEMPGTAGQSDCILILSMDQKEKTIRILQISRDTMTDVDLYDVMGNYFSSIQAQIAVQYAYGNGEKSSCWAARKTVSELLYSLPVDAYISMNLEGISVVNDAVGGVTLTLTEDATEIDKAFRKGESITLTGEQAEAFVRYRDTDVSGSNQSRMERQMQYIPALLKTVREKVGSGGDYYQTFYSLLEPYTVTDLNANQINQLALCDFLEDETETVPGTLQAGEEHDEFYVDEDALYDLIIKMFYREVG